MLFGSILKSTSSAALIAATLLTGSCQAASSTASASASSSSSTSSIPTIEIVGNKFFYSNNGSQFYIKGIAYQSDVANSTSEKFNDPLSDTSACKRDLPYLKELQTNVLRVYAINTSLDHSGCLDLFADNDIYIIADLSEPGLSIDRDSPSWTVELYNRYTSVVDLLQSYDNVLGFFAGNEVTNNYTNTDASAFVKAAVRDTKAYIKDKDYRSIPVGYSTNDDADTRSYMAKYFACGDDDVHADFYGINMYEWCGDSSFTESGYAARTKEFSNVSIPVFFSEYGCNTVRPRKFTDVAALYSDEMTDVWSGGIVYMYFEEANNYGLVSVSGDSVSTLTDFDYLSSEIAKISPTTAKSSAATATGATVACPASTGSDWKANTKLPPTPNQGICDCVSKAAACVVDSSVDEDDYQDLFSYICGEVSCDGISGNGTTGKYGAFSFCSAKEQLNFVLNLYYQAQDSDSSACDFSGSASIVDEPKTDGVCSSVLAQAGSSGTGSVTADVTGTFTGSTEATGTGKSGSSDSDTTSGSSSDSSSSSSSTASSTKKKNAADSVSTTGKTWTLLMSCTAIALGFTVSIAM